MTREEAIRLADQLSLIGSFPITMTPVERIQLEQESDPSAAEWKLIVDLDEFSAEKVSAVINAFSERETRARFDGGQLHIV